MRPTRPTGLVPIDTHALNASTHHGLGLQGISLPSAPSTPSQAAPALPSRTVRQANWARAEGRKRRARASASSLLPRFPLEVPATAFRDPLAGCLEGEHSRHLKTGCADAPRVSESGMGHLSI